MFFRLSVLTIALFAARATGFAQPDSLVKEWKLLAAHNELIKSNEAYVVFDAQSSEMTIRLGNALVWTLAEDSGTAKLDVAELTREFNPDTALIFAVESVRLLEFEPRFPDSLLKIVSEAMDMDPRLLQREIPVTFEIRWHDGPRLIVHSMSENDPVTVPTSFRQKLGTMLEWFEGRSTYRVQIDREYALTLYRVMKRGPLTLVER